MSTVIRTLVAGAVAVGATLLAAHSGDADAHGIDRRCTRLDRHDVAVDVVELRGDRARVEVDLVGDGPFCDDTIHIRSLAAAGGRIGADDPAAARPDKVGVSDSTLASNDLEILHELRLVTAFTYSKIFEIDRCWAGIQVHLDDGTPLFEQVLGDGCELTVATDFWVDPHGAEIHVVQQTGNIQPPHIWTVLDDDVTVLTGLPSGTWYVKVYDGWTPGSDIAIDGGPPVEQSTVYGVADGSHVDITLWQLHDPT